ncbi:Uma2 family endonuclease [Actinacidiphila epipremni]|nr:Uma2 family endonuclease [Actinacidiphila epipremni]
MTAEAPPHMAPAQPDGSPWPVPPENGYTVDDFFRLDLPPHTELIDGSLVFVSPQRDFHTMTMFVLERSMQASVPEGFRVRREMAVVLDRRNVPEPDLIVLSAVAVTDRRRTRYDAADVHLAVEVVSPDSESRDRDYKPHKYAEAGIPHFWRVEMSGPHDQVVVYTFELEPTTKKYVPTGVHRDQLKVDVPYPISVDLTEIDRM